jgi:hypothetical protein
MLRRHALSDEHWDRIKDLLPGKQGDPGVTAADNRLFVDAVLWIARPVPRGVIFPSGSATETQCGNDAIAGPAKEFGGGSSRSCKTRTWNGCSWTAASSAPTSMRRAQKRG